MTGRAGLASGLAMDLTLPGTELSVRVVRQCAGLTLPGVGCLPSLVEDAAAVLGELAGNAVRHTASGRPGGVFTVEVWRETTDVGRAVVSVAVHDAGSAAYPVLRPVSESAEGGRGLLLVAGLASRWGVMETGAMGGGRVVWAELDAGTAPPMPVSLVVPRPRRRRPVRGCRA
ncbi:ATP-binding protein [Nonomuraea longicatena]|uniref:Histidine kinase/HSP90-like ATPase domain-containing protein n=1 Tax=Nonomuraea longicatena TaxID=83682 RepID=A0ABP3Z2N5_9ACTN